MGNAMTAHIEWYRDSQKHHRWRAFNDDGKVVGIAPSGRKTRAVAVNDLEDMCSVLAEWAGPDWAKKFAS
jgi:hypothetical protein